NQTFGNALSEVFLDTKSIQIGGNIGADIKSALKRADVLIVVSTGVLLASHSWTGFELGLFEASHVEQNSASTIRGKVITICRLGTVPAPVENRRYVSLGIDEDLFDASEDKFEQRIEVSDNDELVTLLGDLHYETSGEKLEVRRDLLDVYREKVKQFKEA